MTFAGMHIHQCLYVIDGRNNYVLRAGIDRCLYNKGNALAHSIRGERAAFDAVITKPQQQSFVQGQIG